MRQELEISSTSEPPDESLPEMEDDDCEAWKCDENGDTRNLKRKTSPACSTSSKGFQKFVMSFTGTLEKFFYRWGYTVASRPYQAITACLLFTLICSMGLMNFTYEDRPDKLLISQSSQLAYDTDWLRSNFPSPVRFTAVILTADNVLTPKVLLKLLEIQEKIESLKVKGRRWNDVCFKLPITKGIKVNSKRRRRSLDSFEEAFDDEFFKSDETEVEDVLGSNATDPYYDPMIAFPEDIYCSIVDSLDQACWQVGPLEIWGFNRSVIENLTQEEIIRKVNHETISSIFGRPVNYTADLGGKIVKNEKGEVIGADAIMLLWAVAVNKTAIRVGEAVRDDGTGELADEMSLAWEKEYLQAMEEFKKTVNTSEMNMNYVAGRSFGDTYKLTMQNDMKIVVLGYAVMFFYVAIMLGRFNMIEQRPYLSVAGISCASLAGLVSCGVCSAFGLSFGNVNKVLPFLLLGVGVDDMFVIMQCWKNLYPNVLSKTYKESIPHRLGMALKTAGASITVTSLTDTAAFAIGATTLLPGLRSFCIYASVGIVAVFFFQVTFFVGWFAIDQARLENRRNAFFFCIQHKKSSYVPNKWSQSSFLQYFFEKILAKAILSKPGKVCVLILTFVFLGVNLNGNLKLRQEFSPMWFLAQDSHIVKYIETRKTYFPNSGFGGFIVGYQVNWTASFEGFEQFVKDMKSSDSIYLFDPWYEDFKKYANRNFRTDIPNKQITPAKFQVYLGKFLFSPIGAKYRQYFKAENDLTCGERASPIQISMMPFKFTTFSGRDEHIPGMNALKGLVRDAKIKFNDNSNGRVFPWSAVFVSWETDEIITDELYRNVTLSLICVLICIFVFLFNFRVCLFCGICVIFTVINVGGIMHYWGLTIDTISVIANVVAIGLCVDYAAHIGLAFMMSKGDKNARATQALRDIGPAVLNGGFSTFLGIVLLANSETHALQSFFKVLTTVVFFGLFHGLVFLPVLLSFFGPDPYPQTLLLSKTNDDLKPKPATTELLPLSQTDPDSVENVEPTKA